jgi:protein ImuB
MDRLACVDLPALSLQLLLERHREWAAHPAVVVDQDAPQGCILQVNELARRRRILPGLRYAAGLALCGDLRAGVVPPDEVARGVARLTETLRRFSPEVEPCAEEPGVFWLDATGLERLFRSTHAWARTLHGALTVAGFRASVVVGFTRFGTYAVAKAGAELRFFSDAESERETARAVPLERLGLEPSLREALVKLGVTTVGAFLELPGAGLFRRFGPEVQRLHRLASGELRPPLRPEVAREAPGQRIDLDVPERDRARILYRIERLLDPLLARLRPRGLGVEALCLTLTLESGERRRETLRPARPTLDRRQLLELLRLRLDAGRLEAGVEAIELRLREAPEERRQVRLFASGPRRDREAADRALARLRAELGAAAVARARLRESHVPEGSFLWEPLARLPAPRRREEAPPPPAAVRRIHGRPLPLPPRSHHLRDDGWLIRGFEHGAVTRFVGPYVVAGGWWGRPVHREYHFAETRRQDLLWVFHDRLRRRWFLHGHVE